jgi:hypothetical protein
MVSGKAFVMAGLVPAIHVFVRAPLQDVDARDERGHDGNPGICPPRLNGLFGLLR